MTLFFVLFILLQLRDSQQLDKGANLALGKPSYQSSTILQGIASNAVDGYRHPDYSQQSCIQTNLAYEPWWFVDLEGTYYITTIIITNRGDCCHERLTNFEIKVGGSAIESGIRNSRCAPKFTDIIDAGKSVEINCNEPLLGRYVTVVIPQSTGMLNFCEVEVYGKKQSTVLRLKLISYGYGETGPDRKPYSRLFADFKSYSFMSMGFNFKLYDIKTGKPTVFKMFDVSGDSGSDKRLQDFLKTIPDDSIVCMVVFISGENYYKNSLPYMEDLLGQSLTADVKWGQSWVFLGYKGVHNPPPHWRQSLRNLYGEGPSVIAKLITLRKAPTGKPTNIQTVAQTGSSIKVTWKRPDDGLTDDDYPFDYYVCINTKNYTFCDLAVKQLYYTFEGLQPTTTYSLSFQPKSGDLAGEEAYMTVSTIEPDAINIKVKLISRVMEDAFYRENGHNPFSSIVVAGVVYKFQNHGHNFVILNATTGQVVSTATFNTYEVPHSASSMASFISSLPEKVIVLMVVFYRAHIYYKNVVAPFTAVCPNAPLSLNEDQSNALICLKGIGQPSWIDSRISSYSVSAAVIEKNILLPKDLTTFPKIEKVIPFSSSVFVEWSAPLTDKFTGHIEHYELCYQDRDFNLNDCDKVNATKLKWTKINLHPWVNYEISIRAATVLGYGPLSPLENTTTLQEAPSGPPENVTIKFVNESSIYVSWLPPARIHQNGIITGYNVCIRKLSASTLCLYTVDQAADQTLTVFADLAPFTEYTMEVKAKTVIGYGPSKIINLKTSTAAPHGPPINLTFIFINSTSLTVTWSPPEEILRNGIIEKYSICVQKSTSLFPCQPVNLPDYQTKYTELGLSPYTVYDVVISAATSAGYGPSVIGIKRTSQEAPSKPPSSFRSTFHNSTSVRLSWIAPAEGSRNGILTKYGLTIIPTFPSTLRPYTVFVNGAKDNYLATNLQPFVKYFFEIRAATLAGLGPASFTNRTTSMAAPSGPPTLILITNTTLTTFQITWSPPLKEKQNGIIIMYHLCIREFGVLFACNDTRNVSSSQLMFSFTGLKPNKEYLVGIKAATKIGFGPSAFVQKMAGKCDNPLVGDSEKISNSQISASSHLGSGHEAYQARFTGLQVWCASGSKTNSYLEIDIGVNLRLLAVATQGDLRHFNSWVNVYKLFHRIDAASWKTVTVSGQEEIQGNNGEGVVKHYLDVPVTARYVRFTVVSFVGEHSCMRVEIFGCTPAVTPKSISVVSWNSSSINVAWEPSEEEDANGDILGYVVCAMRPPDTSCQQNLTYTDRNTKQQLVTGLKPYRVYIIRVSSYNLAGAGPGIEIEQRTAETTPSRGPETIDIIETSTNSIKIYWSEINKEYKNGIIQKYALCYKEHESDPESGHNCTEFRELPLNPRIFLLENLKPFTEYIVFIKAATLVGWGPDTFHLHSTLSAPPSGPPTSVSIQHFGSSVLEVTWFPPEADKQNGAIVGYRVCAQEINEGQCDNIIIVNGSKNIQIISGLKPFTMYAVTVEARTDGGYGPTAVFHHKTGESIPSGVPTDITVTFVNKTSIGINWKVPSGAPTDITVTFVNKTSIGINWKDPEPHETNGVLTSHILTVHEQLSNGKLKVVFQKTLPRSTLSWVFNKLTLKTEYIIEVRSGTKAGFGPPTIVHQMTTGAADVTYIKKSNKAYVALAKAGISVGALSILFLLGLFIFISLLVMGYVPHTRPWVEKRRKSWRKKVQKQTEERVERESDESEFDSDFESSGSESGYSDDDSYDSNEDTVDRSKKKQKAEKEKKTEKNKKKSKKTADKTSVNEHRREQSENKGAEKRPKPMLDMYGSRPDDIVAASRLVKSRTKNTHTGALRNNYGSHQGIYKGELKNIYGLRPEDIYGGATENIYGSRLEDIYGCTPSGAIYGGTPGDIYGSRREEIYGTAGVSQDIYG